MAEGILSVSGWKRNLESNKNKSILVSSLYAIPCWVGIFVFALLLENIFDKKSDISTLHFIFIPVLICIFSILLTYITINKPYEFRKKIHPILILMHGLWGAYIASRLNPAYNSYFSIFVFLLGMMYLGLRFNFFWTLFILFLGICVGYLPLIIFDFPIGTDEYYFLLMSISCAFPAAGFNELTINLRRNRKAMSLALKETNEKLKRLDEQKTHFFQNVSHELRTPLTLIMAPLEKAAIGDYDQKSMQMANRNSKRLYRLVNQLLDFQKIEAGQKRLELTPIDLVRFIYICSDYFTSSSSLKNINIKCTLNGELLNDDLIINNKIYVMGEIDALEKITFNLLSNALKFTPENGIIEIGLSTNIDTVRIFVRDSGPGISEEGKKKLFRVFSQINNSITHFHEGSGLGLALVKELTTAMKGKVGVDSELGKGSTFWADIPICESKKPVLDFLFVDDEALLRDLFDNDVKINENIKTYEIVESSSKAREILSSFAVKCILSDALMPEEDGVSLLSYVAATQPSCKRLLLTGHADKQLLQDAINKAMIDKIYYKPVNLMMLFSDIEQFLKDSPIKEVEISKEDYTPKDWVLSDAKSASLNSHDVDDKPETVFLTEGDILVLVVDDLKDMRDLISHSLRKKDFKVITAETGKDGLESARKFNPDLIISDWMMPKMSGPQMIKELMKDEKLISTPVILLTAKSDEESRLKGTMIGANAFLSKPFDEIELLSLVDNMISLKKQEKKIKDLNRHLSETVLKRYLPPDLVDKIVSGEKILEQKPQTKTVTILFSDIKDFTKHTTDLGAQKISRMLNEYLNKMIEVVFTHRGTIDKFIGDSIMVIFGAPIDMDGGEQAKWACRCALNMQEEVGELNKKWKDEGLSEIQIRIGIHSGPAVVGHFGNKMRSDYTAIGNTINVASRIESHCKPGKVFISGEVCDFLPEDSVLVAGKYEIKGLNEAKSLFELKAEKI